MDRDYSFDYLSEVQSCSVLSKGERSYEACLILPLVTRAGIEGTLWL